MSTRGATAALFVVAVGCLLTPVAASSQEPPEDPSPTRANPFADFHTQSLSNGLKVWLKRLEGESSVYVSVGVPYGSDRDPPGKQQLAHLTEHVLFSDHDGRTEQEIMEQIQRRGGILNGVTYWDRTFYFVTIGREHGPFAIEWLSRIVSPRTMEPEVVARNRSPVAVEIGARPLQVFEQIAVALNPEWLLPPGFWEREFGLETRPPLYDRWAALHRITADDIQAFYDRYYAPGAMTLTIVGDVDPDETLAVAEATFGSFPVREVAPRGYAIEDPQRRRAVYYWGFGSDIRYDTRFKLYEPSLEDRLRLLFIRDLLSHRLIERLRYGERKASYTPQVVFTTRGPAAYLRIRTDISEEQYDFAREVLGEEIELLRSGSLAGSEFESDRATLIERLRTANLTARQVGLWTQLRFYDRDVFDDFPDVLGFYERVTQEDVASFAAANLVPERQYTQIAFKQPIGQGVIALLAALVIFLTHRGIAGALTRPIDMKEIRYIARLRASLPLRILRLVVFAGLALILARLLVAALMWVGSVWILTVDSYVMQTVSFALTLSLMVALALLYLARFPRKLLVFPDHIRIKSWAYASRVLEPAEVTDISLRAFRDVWLSRDLFRCTALTFGLLAPGLYIRPRSGRGIFFRARDTEELMGVLRDWKGVRTESG